MSQSRVSLEFYFERACLLLTRSLFLAPESYARKRLARPDQLEQVLVWALNVGMLLRRISGAASLLLLLRRHCNSNGHKTVQLFACVDYNLKESHAISVCLRVDSQHVERQQIIIINFDLKLKAPPHTKAPFCSPADQYICMRRAELRAYSPFALGTANSAPLCFSRAAPLN